ncbi:uncharacterized protein LOC117788226 [Drosophila innubila]|uniref:uncharacterized protein LOC117788226 n=1 Tax=Drosophila innubila TaxID=198719 RepID=UPI00148CC6FD|nr:uncharacterized protein LOC117788226 [Drosophila innubila]
MFRYLAICALATFVAAAPGFVEQHHVVATAPVVTKVVQAAPLATSHQSFTQFHNQAVITPVVKTVPVVQHVAPVVPVVKHVSPVVHHVAPVVPVVKHVAPVVPVVKTFVAPAVHHQTYVAPVSVVKTVPHAVSHQSHTQIHQKAVYTPVVKTIATPVVPVVNHHVAVAAPVAHVYHH